MCASACLGASLIVVSSALLTLAPMPCASALTIEMPWRSGRAHRPASRSVGVLRRPWPAAPRRAAATSSKCLSLALSLSPGIGVDRLRLVRDRDSGRAGGETLLVRGLEVAGVERDPGVDDRRVLRERLAVALVQAVPGLLQARRRVGVALLGIRELAPALGHAALREDARVNSGSARCVLGGELLEQRARIADQIRCGQRHHVVAAARERLG